MHKSSNTAFGRSRNVVVHAVPHSVAKEGKRREKAVRYHGVNLIRTEEKLKYLAIGSLFRLGGLQEHGDTGGV